MLSHRGTSCRVVLVLLMLAGLAAAGCESDSGAGNPSCFYHDLAECDEHPVPPPDEAAVRTECGFSSGATYHENGCPMEGVVGSCRTGWSGGGVRVARFYAPRTLTDVETWCTQQKGTLE